MSSFGGARLPPKRVKEHLRAPPPISPPSSSKRKPFAPSSIVVDMSGPPPALPPLQKPEALNDRVLEDLPQQQPLLVRDSLDGLDSAFAAAMRQMSPRWLHLTTALWHVLILDANRSVDKPALRNFLDAIEWRISGQVTEQEFLSLYSEWMATNYALLKRRNSISMIQFRQIVVEKNYAESELDLMLSVMLYENSRSLLNRPLSFCSAPAQGTLDVCSRRWLSLAEDLFFLLDSPGYGSLQFDQIFFFSACLVFGLQSWTDESGVESDMSVGMLTAIAANIFKDAFYSHTGAANVSNTMNLLGQELGSHDADQTAVRASSLSIGADPNISAKRPPTIGSPDYLNCIQANAGGCDKLDSGTDTAANFCVGLTMPIFKHYLIKMGIGESVLLTLLDHVKHTLASIARRVSSWCDKDITDNKWRTAAVAVREACAPLELTSTGWRGVVGPPLLWEATVMRVSGRLNARCVPDMAHSGKWSLSEDMTIGGEQDINSPGEERRISGNMLSQCTEEPLPAILSFLLTDGEKTIPMSIRALGEAVSAFDAQNASPDVAGMNLLHSTVWKLVKAYNNWGQVGARPTGMSPAAELKASGIPSAGTRKDPIYQFILAALTEYKEAQLCLCSAFVDVILYSSKKTAENRAGGSVSTGPKVVALACAALLPRGEVILKEFQAYEKTISAAAAGPKSAGPSSQRRNSMIKSRGSKWDAFSADGRSDSAGIDNPTVQAADTSPAVPFQARKAAPHRRTSAPIFSSVESTDYISLHAEAPQVTRTEKTDEKIPNNMPFASIRGLFSEVSVDSREEHAAVTPVQSRIAVSSEVAHRSYDDVPNSMEELSPNWTPAEASLIANAVWKPVHTDVTNELDSVTGKSAEHSTASDFTAEADKLQQKLVDLLILSNPQMSKEQQQQLNDVVGQVKQLTLNQGDTSQSGSAKSRKSEAMSRLEDELKAEQLFAVSGGDTGLPATPSRAGRPGVERRSSGSSVCAASESEHMMDMSTASSVVELLQQGHSAGQYAQTLRDLLRRMSRKNSNLQLKTLEDIIKLGESIIAQEGPVENSTSANSSGGRHGFGPMRVNAGGLRGPKGVSDFSHQTPPADSKQYYDAKNTNEYMDSEAKSTLLGEDTSPSPSPGRGRKSPKSRIISFMDEVVTDVGGSAKARKNMASRTAAVPGRTPSPGKNRRGGSGMSRGLKAKPPPAKAFGHNVS